MWRRLLRPDVLFLLGTLQGLLPYGIILAGAVPEMAVFQVSYYPVAIWIIGYLSFWIGTRLVPVARFDILAPEMPVSLKNLKVSLVLLILLSLVQMVGLAKVYGGIPLLLFASGGASVNDTNSAQATSGFGQVGAAALTLSLLVAVLILMVIKSRQTRRPVSLWLATGAFVAFVLCVFNGKRQGLFMYVLVCAAAMTVTFGNPLEAVAALFRFRLRGRGGLLIGLGASLLVLPVTSGFANLRNNGQTEQSGLQELESYYLYPTMNLSLQCIQAGGFGPYRFKPMGVFASLLPAKLPVPATLIGTEPPRVEITSPSGFYERLQWDTGLWGIILFPCACGAFCQTMYRLAFRRYAALLTYGFIAWALFSAPIYNHFLNLLFLPLPACIFWLTSAGRRELTSLLRLAASHHVPGTHVGRDSLGIHT